MWRRWRDEIRNPKSETQKKPEVRRPKGRVTAGCFGFRYSDLFRASGFGVRICPMKWEIIHRTQYTYASPVRDSFNEARLQPFSDEWQTVDHFLLKILPATQLLHHRDFYSNVVHRFEIPRPHNSLLVESHLRITTRPRPQLAETEMAWPL